MQNGNSRRPRGLVMISFSILMAAGLLVIAGCARKPETAPGEKVTVRMWVFPMLPELRDQLIYDELLRRFQVEHPELNVEVETLPWAGRTQKMITAIAGNRAPYCV